MPFSQPSSSLFPTNWNVFSSAHIEDIKLILENRTEEEKNGDIDGHGISPIHGAAEKTTYPEIITLLIDNGYYVNSRTRKGLSPLHYAVVFNKEEKITKQLLKNGAHLDAKDKDGNNPLHLFCMFGEKEAVGLCMMDYIDILNIDFTINIRNNEGKLPIDYIDKGHKFYFSSFHWRLKDLTFKQNDFNFDKQKPYLISSDDICKYNRLSNAYRGFKQNFKRIINKHKVNVNNLANRLEVAPESLYDNNGNSIKVAPEIMFLYLFHHSNGKYLNDCMLWYNDLNYKGKLSQQELLELIN